MDFLKQFLKPEIIWFLVGLILLISEFAIPGLVVFFFGVGAWVVALVCLFTDISINAQLGIFIVCSVVSLLLLRSWLRGLFMGHVTSRRDMNEQMDEFLGKRGVVTEKITPKLPGKVELHGTRWAAQADADIDTGAVVEIVGKDNLTLKVKAV